VEDPPSDGVVIHHFEQGNEELVEIVKSLSAGSELWIVGNGDAAGFGALGITACMAAESSNLVVRTLIFETHSISRDAEVIIHSLRQSPFLLEQHLKYTCAGEVLVRRLVYGSLRSKPYASLLLLFWRVRRRAKLSRISPAYKCSQHKQPVGR
jgi:hypothetical protein